LTEITAIPELLKTLELSGCVVKSQRTMAEQTSRYYLYYTLSLPAGWDPSYMKKVLFSG
jgi:predicted transcriptional regulator